MNRFHLMTAIQALHDREDFIRNLDRAQLAPASICAYKFELDSIRETIRVFNKQLEITK